MSRLPRAATDRRPRGGGSVAPRWRSGKRRGKDVKNKRISFANPYVPGSRSDGSSPGGSTPYLERPGLKVATPDITCRAFPGRLRTGGPEVADRWRRGGEAVKDVEKM